MLAFVKEANIPVQTRVFDHDKKALLQMSMTELYAIYAVAHASFVAACNYRSRLLNHQLPQKCLEAIEMVKSCCKLIHELKWFPVHNVDGYAAVHEFEHAAGQSHMKGLQFLALCHLKQLKYICTMKDTDVLLTEDPKSRRSKRQELSKTQASIRLALKSLDKPNVHSLRELLFTTLPMVGYIGRVGELVLENTHQKLKRTITQSNKRDIQLQCVRDAASSDWPVPLNTLSQGIRSGPNRHF